MGRTENKWEGQGIPAEKQHEQGYQDGKAQKYSEAQGSAMKTRGRKGESQTPEALASHANSVILCTKVSELLLVRSKLSLKGLI